VRAHWSRHRPTGAQRARAAAQPVGPRGLPQSQARAVCPAPCMVRAGSCSGVDGERVVLRVTRDELERWSRFRLSRFSRCRCRRRPWRAAPAARRVFLGLRSLDAPWLGRLGGDDRRDSGDKGALLRREGLYSSLISQWRKQRDQGALQALAAPPGRPRSDARDQELTKLRRENASARILNLYCAE
jgi:hypothetical protein